MFFFVERLSRFETQGKGRAREQVDGIVDNFESLGEMFLRIIMFGNINKRIDVKVEAFTSCLGVFVFSDIV